MGLLDNLKPNSNPDTDFVKLQNPSMGPADPDKASFSDWNVDVPNSTQAQLFKQVQEVPKMATEGIESGNSAADALFNNNTTAFSRAISSKANRLMATSRSSNNLNAQLNNVKRQQLQENQNLNDMNDVYKIKRQNFAGQLKFSAEMSNYYNQLSALKIQALGSIIGGGLSVAGKMAAG
jgi:hypothetical protein